MKKIKTWAVIIMCLLSLLSLYGCKKPHNVDGPDMEMKTWDEFTLSQSSDDYSQCYAYTVKHDSSWKYYLSVDEFDYELGYPAEKSVELDSATVNGLIGLHIEAQPLYEPDELEAELLDGTHLSLVVIDQNGKMTRRAVTQSLANNILEILELDIKKLENEK